MGQCLNVSRWNFSVYILNGVVSNVFRWNFSVYILNGAVSNVYRWNFSVYIQNGVLSNIFRWNFSVGEHDVALLPRPGDVPHLTAGERVEGDDDSTLHSCPPGKVHLT